MMVDPALVESAVATTNNLLATAAGDNGGFFFPAAGLISVGALILYLAPPLKED